MNQRFGHPRPPGPRALARRAGRARATSCSRCSTRAGGAAASATPRRSASSARRRGGAAPLLERDAAEPREPVWLEKALPVQARAPRAARARRPRRPPRRRAGYELIDYKTGRPRSAEQLRDDVQLSLYAVAAKEAWQVESRSEAYHYVLDDEKVRVPAAGARPRLDRETVARVADGIEGQGFEPTPSFSACSWCDYRIVCPAAER
jgi:DNA helicase-2/ATP-dependent DNA helicase PcrA